MRVEVCATPSCSQSSLAPVSLVPMAPGSPASRCPMLAGEEGLSQACVAWGVCMLVCAHSALGDAPGPGSCSQGPCALSPCRCCSLPLGLSGPGL